MKMVPAILVDWIYANLCEWVKAFGSVCESQAVSIASCVLCCTAACPAVSLERVLEICR